jgi:hypothetical protein
MIPRRTVRIGGTVMTDWLGVVLAAINVCVTAYIAYAVQKGSRRVVQMEQDRGIKDAWIEVDQAALGSDEDLDLLDGMIHPDSRGEDRTARRKRWLAYMILNPLEAAWTSATAGNMQAGAVSSSEHTMRAIVRDPVAWSLIENFVYGDGFRARCLQFRREWEAASAQETPRPPSTRTTSPVV